MAFLTAIAAGIASFFVAVAVACKIHAVFTNRWTDKRINVVSAVFCFALIGSSAYTMAAFNVFSFVIAVAIHLGVGCVFVAIVLLGVMNYVEGFVLATIFCILISILVPAIQKAVTPMNAERKQPSIGRPTRRLQGGVTFGAGHATWSMNHGLFHAPATHSHTPSADRTHT